MVYIENNIFNYYYNTIYMSDYMYYMIIHFIRCIETLSQGNCQF